MHVHTYTHTHNTQKVKNCLTESVKIGNGDDLWIQEAQNKSQKMLQLYWKLDSLVPQYPNGFIQ